MYGGKTSNSKAGWKVGNIRTDDRMKDRDRKVVIELRQRNKNLEWKCERKRQDGKAEEMLELNINGKTVQNGNVRWEGRDGKGGWKGKDGMAGMERQGWNGRDGMAGMEWQGWNGRDGMAGMEWQGWNGRDGVVDGQVL